MWDSSEITLSLVTQNSTRVLLLDYSYTLEEHIQTWNKFCENDVCCTLHMKYEPQGKRCYYVPTKQKGVVKLKHGLIWMCGDRKKVFDYHVPKK